MVRHGDRIPFGDGTRPLRAGLLRWPLAALLVVAAHGAVAYAVLARVPDEPPAGNEQAPILIELAAPAATPDIASTEAVAEPEATEPPPEVETPEPEPEPEIEPEPEPEPEPVSEPEPEEQVEPEPTPDPVPPEVEEPEPEPEPTPEPAPEPEPVVEAAPDVVPVPTFRPTPPPKVRQAVREKKQEIKPRQKVERKKQRRQVKKAAPPPSTATKGRQQRQVSQGAKVSRSALTSWRNAVQARLNRYKRSPRGGGSGTVTVSFRMDGNGRVASVRVARSAGRILDDAAVSLLRRASPFPAPPGGKGVSLTVPIRFR